MKQIRGLLQVTMLAMGLTVGVLALGPVVATAGELEGDSQNAPIEQRDIDALDCSPERNDYRQTTSNKCDLYRKYINPIIWFLSALVGVAVTIGIVVGGIRYSASGGDPGQAAAAKKQIRNAVVALLVYIFLLAGLNWLIPGGIR